MQFNFKGKVILITGGTSGIGKQLVNDFLKLKGKVICTTTSIKKHNYKKNLTIEHLDFNSSSSTNNFLNKKKKLKKVDVLINNPGTNPLEIKGGIIGGSLINGYLCKDNLIEIRPGIYDNKNNYFIYCFHRLII